MSHPRRSVNVCVTCYVSFYHINSQLYSPFRCCKYRICCPSSSVYSLIRSIVVFWICLLLLRFSFFLLFSFRSLFLSLYVSLYVSLFQCVVRQMDSSSMRPPKKMLPVFFVSSPSLLIHDGYTPSFVQKNILFSSN